VQSVVVSNSHRPDTAYMNTLPELVATASTVVWDFDGVVADTEPVQAAAYEVVLQGLRVDPDPGWFSTWVGTPEPGIWGGLREQFGLVETVEALTTQRADVYGELARGLMPAWFVAETLAVPCPHRIISAGNHYQIEMLLELWGIKDAFTLISATGSPNGDSRPKADRLLSALGPGAVLFEDSARYLAIAQGHRRVGVQHRFNNPSTLDCELLVSHETAGVWFPHATTPSA
jgi:phosphoglycolate phosphatase-like HAD superfamily hydrolase